MLAKKKKRMTATAVLAILLIALISWIWWANTALELNIYRIASGGLPDGFDGYRIAHVSDLHNAELGEENEALLTILHDAEPDVIAITGDLIESRNTDIEIALQFAAKAVKIAPCYYVTGNHEARILEYSGFENGLIELVVVVLENERVELEIAGEAIALLGVHDPSFQSDGITPDETAIDRALDSIVEENDGYAILLSHRPELFDTYTEKGIELVLCGHAHGGQFRLPFVGGLAAPNQGLFPKYDAGLYTERNTNMIVSRGIGNSIIPFRFNNRPEVVLIELRAKG